ADAYDFPRGIGKKGDLDFSFSGLKTSLRYRVQAMPEDEVRGALPDICASYQAAVMDALSSRVEQGLALGSYRSVGLSGGVANNFSLRSAIDEKARAGRAHFMAASPRHTGDNAGMVAFAAWIDPKDASRHSGNALGVDPAAYL
ncbi:MAG TPA: tRNA (adenosine(37)-N6)-threonylcarbamoyltransferase complex transferase subunit TsaD, partial [Opitutaceae bacterium]